MTYPECPRCQSTSVVKSGIVNDRQRFKCKRCKYSFTVNKLGKQIDSYYVIKALQLYLEGISYREIERLLGVSHVSVMNWVRKYRIKAPTQQDYRPTYKVLNHAELSTFFSQPHNLQGAGMIVTEVGDKYMLIKWERFKD
ncbi:IS1/IS1595 family N-terminal zinc-binding domain-containing protein [Tunicatimonas pelagia]|uniref:IS1/IS1595 family N-terminal zinc-binding domain-containing protein n=1 Tax=Tunicatimonas pelagia TaxID=931531 RepID=UPI002665A9D3|nr:helix-turn-helix domain-containing protein [Tunicatimonas pelagia]WKN43032.1 helix-turn-helix domain-containing protein [Tunicatimonas pelagia]